ncbi:SOS response-associated peptidase [Bacteroides thetaiotaomicron]|nr:SOS response-associated peptidase [Bacteroides thetaiotaomicron]
MSYHYFFGRSTGFQLGTHPFLGKKRRGCDRNKKDDTNARADTIFEKPSFREPIMKKRCIVPSTGYFEWRHEGANKIPYYIYVKDEPIFSMAGIYDRWLDKDTGEEHETFSIITTDTNSLTDYIDNTKHRMPAILTREEEEKWLNPSLSKAEIASLLKPFDTEKMDAYVIRNDFLKKSPNDPTIVQRT